MYHRSGKNGQPDFLGTDLILADGNPLEGLNVLTNCDNFKIIMKEGQIYRNILEV